jgi:hypothetical protein
MIGRARYRDLEPKRWIAATLFLATSSCFAAPGPCSNKTAAYNGYKVLEVDVKNPIGFIAPWNPLSRSLKKGLKLRANEPFSADDFEQDSAYLSAALKAEFASSTQTVKLSYAGGDILDCDPETRTLRVVYPIFTSVVPGFIAPSIEEQTKESLQPGTTGATRASERDLRLAPLIGYNQARGAWGGLELSYRLGKLQLRAESEGSGNSQVDHFEIGNNCGPVKHLWSFATLAGTFDYIDTPAGITSFEEGKITARFSASTAEFSQQHAILRYGSSLEGGHQQSGFTATEGSLPPNSSYGSLKLYVGMTGRPQNSAVAASYGLQLGNTFINGVPIFKKHLIDLGYNRNFPIPFRKPLGDREDFKGPLSGSLHRSFNLETTLAAGFIQDASGAPLAERFLGGNQVRPFVQDPSWVILSDAFIRSIPENQLGAQSEEALGGSRFYSANATISFTVWGRSMLPKELAAEGTEFPGILNPAFQTAARSLANAYKTKDPEYIRLTADLSAKGRELASKLTAVSDTLKEIPPQMATQAVIARQIKDIKRNLISTGGAARIIAAEPDPQVIDQLVTGALPALSTLTQDLTKNLRDTSKTDLADHLDSLVNDARTLGNSIRDADNLPSSKYDDQAWQALAPGHRAIDVFLHELNVYSISPVAMFDVARVWPVNQGVHYGVGPGLRLSLVNVNFTVGYGFNPQPGKGESIGAISFKLDVTSLF